MTKRPPYRPEENRHNHNTHCSEVKGDGQIGIMRMIDRKHEATEVRGGPLRRIEAITNDGRLPKSTYQWTPDLVEPPSGNRLFVPGCQAGRCPFIERVGQ